MARLDGKVIVVKGGGQGFGRAYCLGLAVEGATVAIAEMAEESALETQVAVLELRGHAVWCTTRTFATRPASWPCAMLWSGTWEPSTDSSTTLGYCLAFLWPRPPRRSGTGCLIPTCGAERGRWCHL